MKKNKHTTIFKRTFFALSIISNCICSYSQILTSSPYSRYGLGEVNLQTFASSSAMGGSFIANYQDTIAPCYINIANPAGLAGLKLSTFEIGGQAQFTKIISQASSLNRKNINFSYGSVGLPINRIGAIAFGILPYTTVGYKITSNQEESSIGNMKYVFQGDGGINKVFLGTGLKPFRKQAIKFYNSNYADTLVKYKQTNKYKRIKFAKQLLSELSIGITGNYLFGTINQVTSIIYPNSTLYYNSKRQRSVQITDFTFSSGIQTHFIIDSLTNHHKSRLLKEKIEIGIGFYVNTPTNVNSVNNTIIYNYALDGFGVERPKDTVLNTSNNSEKITLPLEMGIGFSVKKGEKLTILADATTINWSQFKYLETPSNNFKNSFRFSVGLNYVPNKLAYGSSNYIKRIHYRLGMSYSDGYLDIKNTSISNYFVSAGVGLPVGIGRFDDVAIVNISAQIGRMGTLSNNLLKEEYVRLVLGFTFNKRWFIKYKYD